MLGRILTMSAFVILACVAYPPEASAECQGNCADCYFDEFSTPYCVGVSGSGWCYCHISYIWGSCQGVSRCREACVYPFCSEARCQESPADLRRTPEAWGYDSATFRPYFRPSVRIDDRKAADLSVGTPWESKGPLNVGQIG
jgi:hypothetical protein